MSPNSIRQTQWAVESLGASARVYLPEGFRLATVEGSAAAAPASLATLRVWHFKQYQPKPVGKEHSAARHLDGQVAKPVISLFNKVSSLDDTPVDFTNLVARGGFEPPAFWL